MSDQHRPFPPTNPERNWGIEPSYPVDESPAWPLLRAERRHLANGRTSFAQTVRYALDGVRVAFRTQRNVRIHCAVGVVAVGLACGLRLPVHQVILVVALTLLVLCAELVNTAIEATLDLHVGMEFNPSIKTIKDMAAASVLVVCIGAAALCASIFLPVIIHHLSR